MNKDVIDIIKEELSSNLTREDIIELLEKSGFDENEIQEALLKVESHKNDKAVKDATHRNRTIGVVAMMVLFLSGFFMYNVFAGDNSMFVNSVTGQAYSYTDFITDKIKGEVL